LLLITPPARFACLLTALVGNLGGQATTPLCERATVCKMRSPAEATHALDCVLHVVRHANTITHLTNVPQHIARVRALSAMELQFEKKAGKVITST
jgi:hypothetical protein